LTFWELAMTDAADLFRGRLDQINGLRSLLAVLGSRMPWHEIEVSLAQEFARRVREGKRIEGWICSGRACRS